MPLRFLNLFLVLLLCITTMAQHADLGTGTLKNQIWWLNWAGVTVSNGTKKTFTTNDGLLITVTFSNANTREPVPTVMSSNYFGSMLYVLYNFSDPTILPSLYDGLTTGVVKFSMSVTASRDGVNVPFYLVTADAEASWEGETTTLTTNGSAWQCITLFRNTTTLFTNPLTGCGAQTISIANTFDGNYQGGQSPIIMTQAPTSGALDLDVTLDHATTTGGMALAFGILQSEDRGDLPSSYGTAQHQLNYTVTNGCSYPSPLPSMIQDTRLFIGSVPGDADPIQYTDDDAIGVDEEAISTFPVYNNSGSYSLTFPVNNTTGGNAWLTGWFDYNRNGSFEASEAQTILVPNNTTSATVTWTGLPQYLPQGTTNDYGFRFRISSGQQVSQQPTGFAPDGEVEDYIVTGQTLCTPITPGITASLNSCAGQQVPLQASGGSTYNWTPATALSDPTLPNPIAAPQTTTTYTVTASNPQGCSGNASVTITTLPAPTITAGDNDTICQNTSATLHAGGGLSYSWTSSDPTFQASGPSITVTPPQSSDYYVQGTGSNGCTATDTIAITIHNIPVFDLKPTDTTVCSNSPIKLIASGGDQYAWLSESADTLGTDSILSTTPGESSTYQVYIADHICNLSSVLAANIIVRPSPVLNITSSNNIDCTIGQSTLNVTGGIRYQWQAGPGITDLFSQNLVVAPLISTTYYVLGTDIHGCSTLDSITVKVNDSIDLSKYPVPSAFTPNNDGHNDCFRLKYWGHITSLQLAVYNRWGQRVFYTSDPAQCWDGTYNGTPQPAGSYAYEIRATTACGVAYRKGSLS